MIAPHMVELSQPILRAKPTSGYVVEMEMFGKYWILQKYNEIYKYDNALTSYWTGNREPKLMFICGSLAIYGSK